MLHGYLDEFDLVDARLKIFAAPQSHLLEGSQLNWIELKNLKYPTKEIAQEFGGPTQMKPMNQILNEYVATVDVPSEIRAAGDYAVKI